VINLKIFIFIKNYSDGAINKMSSLQILAEVCLMNPVHINKEKEPEHNFKGK